MGTMKMKKEDEYVVERKLSNYGWEQIYLPVRIIKNGKVIFQIETKVKTEVVVKVTGGLK